MGVDSGPLTQRESALAYAPNDKTGAWLSRGHHRPSPAGPPPPLAAAPPPLRRYASHGYRAHLLRRCGRRRAGPAQLGGMVRLVAAVLCLEAAPHRSGGGQLSSMRPCTTRPLAGWAGLLAPCCSASSSRCPCGPLGCWRMCTAWGTWSLRGEAAGYCLTKGGMVLVVCARADPARLPGRCPRRYHHAVQALLVSAAAWPWGPGTACAAGAGRGMP